MSSSAMPPPTPSGRSAPAVRAARGARGAGARLVRGARRPRRGREALSWWEAVLDTEGESGREAKWDHPDLLPTAEVLSGTPQAPREDAAAPAEGAEELADVSIPVDFDAELERLLSGEGGESAPREDEQGGVRGADGEDDQGEDGPTGHAR